MVQKSKVLLYGGWQLKVIAPDVVFNPTFARIWNSKPRAKYYNSLIIIIGPGRDSCQWICLREDSRNNRQQAIKHRLHAISYRLYSHTKAITFIVCENVVNEVTIETILKRYRCSFGKNRLNWNTCYFKTTFITYRLVLFASCFDVNPASELTISLVFLNAFSMPDDHFSETGRFRSAIRTVQ